MPLYEIEHVCPITPDQQQSIANAIVKIHSEMFTTPSLFVNVRFKDTNALPLFVAGQRVSNTATIKTRFHSFTLLYKHLLHKDLRTPVSEFHSSGDPIILCDKTDLISRDPANCQLYSRTRSPRAFTYTRALQLCLREHSVRVGFNHRHHSRTRAAGHLHSR